MGELRRALGYQHRWEPSAVLPWKIVSRTDRGGQEHPLLSLVPCVKVLVLYCRGLWNPCRLM